MIDVHVTFENVEQIRRFREKLLRDLHCSVSDCNFCTYGDICDIFVRFYVDLGAAEFKYAGDKQ